VLVPNYGNVLLLDRRRCDTLSYRFSSGCESRRVLLRTECKE